MLGVPVIYPSLAPLGVIVNPEGNAGVIEYCRASYPPVALTGLNPGDGIPIVLI